MEIVKNKYLKSEFEKYQNLTTQSEKESHLKKVKKTFKTMSETEKETVRSAFKSNLDSINDRLKEIDKEIQGYKTIEVYPKNEEEIKLIEMLLNKMNIGFALR